MRLLDRFGPILVNTYGASETGMVSVLAAPDYGLDHPERLSTAGRPRPGVEVRIVAGDGAAAPVGTQGVIEVRLPGMASGYIGRPGDPAFHDGWYTTGDLGFLDADGFLHVRGRAADARDVDGVSVMPLDLEDAACAHPDVAYAVALPPTRGGGRSASWSCGRGESRSRPTRSRDASAATVEPAVRRGTGGGRRPPAGDRAGQAGPAIVTELLSP